jgi:hypothetical protein
MTKRPSAFATAHLELASQPNLNSLSSTLSNCIDMAAQSKEAVIPPWGLAVAGATGAVIANALVYPLDM